MLFVLPCGKLTVPQGGRRREGERKRIPPGEKKRHRSLITSQMETGRLSGRHARATFRPSAPQSPGRIRHREVEGCRRGCRRDERGRRRRKRRRRSEWEEKFISSLTAEKAREGDASLEKRRRRRREKKAALLTSRNEKEERRLKSDLFSWLLYLSFSFWMR